MKDLTLNVFKKQRIYNDRSNLFEKYDISVIDSKLIPLFNEAKNHSIEAQHNLYFAFSEGKGVKQDLDIAEYFLNLTLETLKLHKEEIPYTLAKLGIYWNLALLEKDRNNFEGMKKGFSRAINYMQDKIPMEKWDFSLFQIMEECLENNNPDSC